MAKVEMQKIVEKMNLKNLTPDVSLEDRAVGVPDTNRPALQLTGFFEHFDYKRVQIIGYVEYTFLKTVDEKREGEDIRYVAVLSDSLHQYSAETCSRSRCFWRRQMRGRFLFFQQM